MYGMVALSLTVYNSSVVEPCQTIQIEKVTMQDTKVSDIVKTWPPIPWH